MGTKEILVRRALDDILRMNIEVFQSEDILIMAGISQENIMELRKQHNSGINDFIKQYFADK